eukprot:3777570-Amphidinium_carterae.1
MSSTLVDKSSEECQISSTQVQYCSKRQYSREPWNEFKKGLLSMILKIMCLGFTLARHIVGSDGQRRRRLQIQKSESMNGTMRVRRSQK